MAKSSKKQTTCKHWMLIYHPICLQCGDGVAVFRYLVPGDLTVCQFMCVIRKRIKLEPEKAMFFFVHDSKNNHNIAPLQSALLSAIYDQHKDEDGFLYITYSGETTFG